MRTLSILSSVALLFGAYVIPLQAQYVPPLGTGAFETWIGGGGDGKWNDSLNWSKKTRSNQSNRSSNSGQNNGGSSA